MKRCLHFSAALLIYLEDTLDPLGADSYDLLNYFSDQLNAEEENEQALLQDRLSYHLAILEGAALIRGQTQEGDESLYYTLTWAGHDYLDAHRSDAPRSYAGLL
ncbi:DUF2513 domain-containing protein [Pseudomonas donghuensis]|uniref:DUF2513 domain-containing protein n=1 Tax=Pseudomonas donghuensis TaxID=1163398 RepID=UPI000C297BEF|nr:DUF2513 domain-containing protein [Pseudomonas donghuensis]PJY94692.1 hypothetical protein COO64_20320 [Pseudomonas donghuensis]